MFSRAIYEKRMYSIASSGVLARFEHPQDPRVLVIPPNFGSDFFEAIAFTDKYQAAILRRTDEEKSKLQESFTRSLKTINFGQSAMVSSALRIINNKIFIKSIRPKQNIDMPKNCELIKANMLYMPEMAKNLEKMSLLFNRMTGKEDLIINILKDPKFRLHPHQYPVINISVFDEGTIWPNIDVKSEEELKQAKNVTMLQPGKGNYFYFKPGFQHLSPERVHNLENSMAFVA